MTVLAWYALFHYIRKYSLMVAMGSLLLAVMFGGGWFTLMWITLWIFFGACVGFIWYWNPDVQAALQQRKNNGRKQ